MDHRVVAKRHRVVRPAEADHVCRHPRLLRLSGELLGGLSGNEVVVARDEQQGGGCLGGDVGG
jgi:hypothetical protein